MIHEQYFLMKYVVTDYDITILVQRGFSTPLPWARGPAKRLPAVERPDRRMVSDSATGFGQSRPDP
jgi:hypothetical protein